MTDETVYSLTVRLLQLIKRYLLLRNGKLPINYIDGLTHF